MFPHQVLPPVRTASARRRVDLEIIIPAYNEARRLPLTLAAVCAALDDLPLSAGVVVVDNGSTDATAEVVRSWSGTHPVRLVGCSRQGKGAAVRRGIASTSARWVGFCDADLATSFDAITAVLSELVAGAQVVIGSRRHPTAELVVPHGVVRRAGSAVFHGLSRRLAPGVSDTQCGFKFFDGDAGRALFADCRSDGFAFDVEVLARASHRGHRIVEVPVTWTAQDGSTFSVVQHGHRAAKELLLINSLLREARGQRPVAGLPVPA